MAIYGGFPVKLKTIVGEPIIVDPKLSAGEISEQVGFFFNHSSTMTAAIF